MCLPLFLQPSDKASEPSCTRPIHSTRTVPDPNPFTPGSHHYPQLTHTLQFKSYTASYPYCLGTTCFPSTLAGWQALPHAKENFIYSVVGHHRAGSLHMPPWESRVPRRGTINGGEAETRGYWAMGPYKSPMRWFDKP